MNQRETLLEQNGTLIIGGVRADTLVEKYGTPLYVFDKEYTEKICEAYTSALSTYYGKGYVSYASKAFCCKEIYRIIDKFNMHADVVSIGEMYTAVNAGFSPKKLTLHGNNKTEIELNYALDNRIGKIVIDSIDEISTLQSICEAKGIVQKVLLRVNPGVEAHTHHYIQTAKIDSKFGFGLDNGDAEKAINAILKCKNLDLIGLHCHIGSQIFEIKSFILALDKMTDYYAYCKKALNLSFSSLNLGGGFGIYYSGDDLKLKPIDYANYVKEISNSLTDFAKAKQLELPELILEPGRSIVGESGVTLYKVGNVKEITNVKNYIAIDGGMFENPRYALYQARYSVDIANKLNQPKTVKYSIAGKCCESGDLIAEDVILPKAEKGDILAVYSTGAYNFSMASNYNRNLIPPVVSVYNGKSNVIVKGQLLDDIISRDI